MSDQRRRLPPPPAAPELAAWLVRQGLTAADLARRLGVGGASVGHWLSGRRRPSLALAAALERITGIPASRWVEVDRAAS